MWKKAALQSPEVCAVIMPVIESAAVLNSVFSVLQQHPLRAVSLTAGVV